MNEKIVMECKPKKKLGHTIWLKVILTILMFLPPYTHAVYDPSKTTDVISAVLSNPISTSIHWLLPLAKILTLVVIIFSMVRIKYGHIFILGYYSFLLIIIGAFQNMAFTNDYGFVWLIGNSLVQYIVIIFCIIDLFKKKTIILKKNFVKNRVWIIFFMILAFLMPYSIDEANNIVPSFTMDVLFNEAAITYCMITPVIIGILLLFSKGVYKPTLSIISYVGFIFGILNMITWFSLQSHNWWMGVLHFPLVIISLYGLIVAHREKNIA